MVLNNTICYVGKTCKYGLVHAADESKVVVQGLDGYIVAEKNGQLLVCSLKENKELRNSEYSKKNMAGIHYYKYRSMSNLRYFLDILIC